MKNHSWIKMPVTQECLFLFLSEQNTPDSRGGDSFFLMSLVWSSVFNFNKGKHVTMTNKMLWYKLFRINFFAGAVSTCIIFMQKYK